MNYIGDQLVTEISYKLKTKTIDIADDNNVSDSMSKKTRGRISKKRDKKVDPSNNIV